MQNMKASNVGVASAVLVISGTPSGFNIGNGFRPNTIPSKDFKWSGPLEVKSVEWGQDQRGGWFRLAMSDGTTPICLFDRLPSDEDRRLVAAAIRAVDPMVNNYSKPTQVQLAVAGRSSVSQYFCGIRVHQLPQPLAPNQCPW